LLLIYFVAGPVKFENLTQRFPVAQQKGIEKFTQMTARTAKLGGCGE
jgi:hypothetical protein